MLAKQHDTTRHHLNPRSRRKDLKKLLGVKDNDHGFIKKIGATKAVATMVHDCWHLLFTNYFAWEAIEQIKLWSTDDLSGFKVYLDIRMRMAWYIVFGGEVLPKRAIEIIKKDWWPECVSVENAVKLGLLKP